MEIRVLWTDSALSQLEDIYDYHKLKASPRIAKELVKTLVEETIILESNPLIGVKEPLLSARPYEYRFLVKNNYKIIYRFNENLIRIISVFDCRQNPNKLERIAE
ncbi:MAG: type II toxin-antitoxin system RelE/ParE family toxin [Bacteroidales bacterium]|jgi:plasmid stabilization system protein ParE|nr:type II toxin-antitoxin system RelE/ParE family toxin [Bacteroidales bacterium]MDD4384107.1 type II toxin-antitoxin system RelE/ParE family toxin [Bacteroidales bacterium]MDY0197202.1 type II toxin-antitoxin system RelE/ParE family toxin [Tenuifilaceae bacterium]